MYIANVHEHPHTPPRARAAPRARFATGVRLKSERQFWVIVCAVSKGDKLEAYRAAAEEAELEARIAEQIKMEEKLDTMGVDEANHYSRELVRVVRDSYLEEEKEVDLARQKAEKERRRRRRVAGRSPLGSGR